MQTPRLGLGLAALTMGAVASVFIATPALAQPAPVNCAGGAVVVYPPRNCPVPNPVPGVGAGLAKAALVVGERTTASSGRGTFDAGTPVEYGVRSVYIKLGTTTANAAGAAVATFTVPASLETGAHNVVFTGVLNGQPNTVSLPFSVVAPAAAAAGAAASPREGSLPFTGSQEAVPIAAAGIALVAAGAGMVVVARRRRSELDESIA